MEIGAITGYVDLAQILLYAFWLFFAGLIYYLVRESHREGYPMETDGLQRKVQGWPVPPPKTFKLHDGREVTVPEAHKHEPATKARVLGGSPGSPLEPTGDPLLAGVGAGAYAMRADVPDMDLHGAPKIVPLRLANGLSLAAGDPDPRGLPVMGADFAQAGVVREVWVDRMEMLIRYLEVEAAGRRVLLPLPFARIGRKQVDVKAIHSHQFANVPATRSMDQITLLEEEKVAAYYGAGTLYADPQRLGPWI
jgi:photosynthetic reaction center H subunit